jgi:hypothetical protein
MEKVMFGWSKKKEPSTLMDQIIVAIYGDPPPKRSADLNTAIQLAYQELLVEVISKDEVTKIANALYDGPMPYSTHDLALSVALNFFKRPKQIEHLRDAQLTARLLALQWTKERKVVRPLPQSFEDTLYKLYKP